MLFGNRFLTARALLLFLATVLTLSISYYFVIALPAANRARLEFERQKYEDSKAEREAKEQRAKEEADRQKSKVLDCQIDAEKAYWDHVKLNGTKSAKRQDVWQAPLHVWDEARKRKKESYEECMALP